MSYSLRSPIRTNKGREATFVRVIRREATETEGLVLLKLDLFVCVFVCLFVCPDCIKVMGE